MHYLTTLNTLAPVAGRLLISIIFLMAGISKITGYAGTQAYMESAGVPGMLLPLVIGLEILGAVALMIGYRTRLAALLLAGFTVVSALLFHNMFVDSSQTIMFMKNLAIAGGLLLLVANGPGLVSVEEGMPKKQ
jgi:putative oxidoreductase